MPRADNPVLGESNVSGVGDYKEDHFIPLELGGNPTDPKNPWPESPHSPNPKDTVEGKLKRLVCSNKITLEQARRLILLTGRRPYRKLRRSNTPAAFRNRITPLSA
jgi:hypothetical protein